MQLAIVFACFGFLSGLTSGQPDYSLEFPVQGTNDRVNVWGMRSLTQFTVCFRMKTTKDKGTPFSYASSTAKHNELLIYFSEDLKLHIGNTAKNTGVAVDDGQLHHICVTWKNSDGRYQVFLDGKLAKDDKGLQTGYIINAGGSLMLGQEQDSLGGSLVAAQSLQGTLKGVNVWSYVLPASTISEMSQCCRAGEGDVYKWSDFIYAIRGNPRLVFEPDCAC